MNNFVKCLRFLLILPLFGCTKLVLTDNLASDLHEALTKKSGFSDKENVSGGVDPAGANAITPLPNGYSHNDYCHNRPLFDALENGFMHIEADIFLKNDKLIVAHVFPYFKDHRTLETLYLQPLSERITEYNGVVYPGYTTPITLVIDIKTNAYKTYNALKPLLEKYRSILSGYENGEMVYRAVTIVLTGNKPYRSIESEHKRLAFIDEDLHKVNWNSVDKSVVIMASCKYSNILKWKGEGTIPSIEKDRICKITAMGHKMGVKVRLWASPENKAVWKELLNCGVDLINTDRLVALREYLTCQRQQTPVDRELYLSSLEAVSNRP